MSKKQKIEIHKDDELAEIDEELDSALDLLESANLTVGGLLEEIELSNREDATENTSPTNGDAEKNPAGSTENQEAARE